MNKPGSDLKRREVFLNTDLDTFHRIVGENEEGRECPICLAVFSEIDLVMALPCSKAHIYHVECLDDHLISQKDEEAECALCREKIDY